MVASRGFTLIEMLVVVLIIGVLAALGIPRFLRSPVPVAEQFIGAVNKLTQAAAEQAQQEGEPRRVFFNLSAATVEIQTKNGLRKGGLIKIPPEVSVGDVVINGLSQFSIGSTSKRTFYFLLNPEGISQEVLLVLNEQLAAGTMRSYEFLLNPFTEVFRVT